MSDNRGEQLKKLLIKFRKSFTILDDASEDMLDFGKLLDLNAQLATPKALNVTMWSLVSEN
jgi:hypothetical protein